MTDVWYISPLIPPEWIAAHGLRPRRLRLGSPGHPTTHAGQGRCPYAEAFADEGEARPAGDLLVATTLCDQMRRSAEVVTDRDDHADILLHVPTTWQDAAAWRLYEEELHRLSRHLVRSSPAAPG